MFVTNTACIIYTKGTEAENLPKLDPTLERDHYVDKWFKDNYRKPRTWKG
jgi:hypothetical protein